eukprot:5377744-Pyramimonas_sp.AAC.1
MPGVAQQGAARLTKPRWADHGLPSLARLRRADQGAAQLTRAQHGIPRLCRALQSLPGLDCAWQGSVGLATLTQA